MFDAQELQFYSDASKNFNLGFGAFCEKSWMQVCWSDMNVTPDMNPSIQYLQLFTLTAAVLAWVHRFQNRKIMIFCDNEAVVSMVNNTTSSCKNCMVLIRFLVLHCLIHNVKLMVKYINTKSNAISDSLSRFQTTRFELLTKDMDMDTCPTPVPEILCDVLQLWLN